MGRRCRRAPPGRCAALDLNGDQAQAHQRAVTLTRIGSICDRRGARRCGGAGSGRARGLRRCPACAAAARPGTPSPVPGRDADGVVADADAAAAPGLLHAAHPNPRRLHAAELRRVVDPVLQHAHELRVIAADCGQFALDLHPGAGLGDGPAPTRARRTDAVVKGSAVAGRAQRYHLEIHPSLRDKPQHLAQQFRIRALVKQRAAPSCRRSSCLSFGCLGSSSNLGVPRGTVTTLTLRVGARPEAMP